MNKRRYFQPTFNPVDAHGGVGPIDRELIDAVYDAWQNARKLDPGLERPETIAACDHFQHTANAAHDRARARTRQRQDTRRRWAGNGAAAASHYI